MHLFVSRNCLGRCSLKNIISWFLGRLFLGIMVRLPFCKNFHNNLFFVLSGKVFIFLFVFDSPRWFLWIFILWLSGMCIWLCRLFWLRYWGNNLIFCEFGFDFFSWFSWGLKLIVIWFHHFNDVLKLKNGLFATC